VYSDGVHFIVGAGVEDGQAVLVGRRLDQVPHFVGHKGARPAEQPDAHSRAGEGLAVWSIHVDLCLTGRPERDPDRVIGLWHRPRERDKREPEARLYDPERRDVGAIWRGQFRGTLQPEPALGIGAPPRQDRPVGTRHAGEQHFGPGHRPTAGPDHRPRERRGWSLRDQRPQQRHDENHSSLLGFCPTVAMSTSFLLL
jgi:hypothetical protein